MYRTLILLHMNAHWGRAHWGRAHWGRKKMCKNKKNVHLNIINKFSKLYNEIS